MGRPNYVALTPNFSKCSIDQTVFVSYIDNSNMILFYKHWNNLNSDFQIFLIYLRSIFYNSWDFVMLLKKCAIVIQTSVFQMRIPSPILTVNYLGDNIYRRNVRLLHLWRDLSNLYLFSWRTLGRVDVIYSYNLYTPK